MLSAFFLRHVFLRALRKEKYALMCSKEIEYRLAGGDDADSMGIKLSKNGWNVAVAGARATHEKDETGKLRVRRSLHCGLRAM